MVIINGNGTMNVCGKTIHCKGVRIDIKDGQIFVGGKLIQDYDESSVLKIEIIGDVESVSSEEADVVVNGKVGSVVSKNGNVTCGDVEGNVDSKNGNVVCGMVNGDCITKNGNIMRKG